MLWGSPQNADRMSVVATRPTARWSGCHGCSACSSGTGSGPPSSSPATPPHRYPAVVRDIVAAGHEVAHHGYLHEQPTGVGAQEEADNLDRGLAALEEVAGVRPVGYRAPMWDLSWRSPALLAERGFLYDSSLMDADAPYELAVTPGAGRRSSRSRSSGRSMTGSSTATCRTSPAPG